MLSEFPEHPSISENEKVSEFVGHLRKPTILEFRKCPQTGSHEHGSRCRNLGEIRRNPKFCNFGNAPRYSGIPDIPLSAEITAGRQFENERSRYLGNKYHPISLSRHIIFSSALSARTWKVSGFPLCRLGSPT